MPARRRRTLFVLAMAGALVLLSTSTNAMTLIEALALAYESNPALKAARAGQRATDELLPLAKQYYWRPQVFVFGQAGRSQINQHLRQSSDGRHSHQRESTLTTDQQAGLTAEFYLYRGGRTAAGIRNAKALIDSGQSNLNAVEQAVLLSVVQAYTGIILYDSQVKIFEDEVKNLLQLQQETNDMLQSRLVTVSDAALVRTYVSSAQVDVRLAQANLGESIAQFVGLVGTQPGTLETWPSLPISVPGTLDEAMNIATSTSPAIKAAKAQVRANEANIDALEGEMLPTVMLYGSVSREWDKSRYSGNDSPVFDEFDTEDTLSGGIQLTMPLYQGGANYASVRQAKQELSQAVQTLTNEQANIRSSVLQYWSMLAAALQSLSEAREGVNQANIAVAGAERQYRDGTQTLQDLLTTRDQRIDSQLNYVLSEYNRLLYASSLFAAMGVFNAQELRLPVTPYNPETYKNDVQDKWIGLGD